MLSNPKFKALAEASSITTNNVEANLCVNTLAKLQNSSLHLENALQYEAQDIPMLPICVGEKSMIGIEGDMVALVAQRSGLSEDTIIEQVYDHLCGLLEEGTELIEGCDTFSKDQLAIVVKEFNPETLYKEIVSEAASCCGQSRLESVNGFIQSINKAKANGYTIVFSK